MSMIAGICCITRWLAVFVTLAGVGSLSVRDARAGGFFLPGHGVRAIGRGAAFVAGGDDPSVIWYNPAAISAVSGHSFLLDTTINVHLVNYARVDSGGNLLPTVSNGKPIAPIPTLAYVGNFWPRWTVGASLSVPSVSSADYPAPNYRPCDSGVTKTNCLDTVQQDAPHRYTIISLHGTLMAQLDLTAAYRLSEQWRIGISLQNLTVLFNTLKATSAYNGIVGGGPEDPEMDALSHVRINAVFNPSAKIGAQWRFRPWMQFGAAVQLPFWIRSGATVTVQVPQSPLYRSTAVSGDSADVSMNFPLTLSGGVEVRPMAQLRVALDLVWEMWSMADTLEFSPNGISALYVPGIGRYELAALTEPLYFRDAISVRLGGEYFFTTWPLIARAGYVFERGAVADQDVSLMTLDHDKHVLSVGTSAYWLGFRWDLVYAFTLPSNRTVNYEESSAKQINPTNPKWQAAVGGGTYSTVFHQVGFGIAKEF